MRRWLTLGLALLATASCGAYTIPVPYHLAGIDRLPNLDPIAVYLFTDKRGEDEPTRLGGIYGGIETSSTRSTAMNRRRER